MSTILRSLCALVALGFAGSQLSEAATPTKSSALLLPVETASDAPKPLSGGFFGGLGGAGAAALLSSIDEDEVAPAELVYVHISREFLSQSLQRAIERDSDVNDVILDTRITGKSHTSGTSEVVLIENSKRAVAEIRLRGTVHSRTMGRNGPAILYNTASSHFEARKQFVIDEQGLRIVPATVTAQTCSNTNNVETTLPGLRGRVAERVTWRRSGEMRAEADAIASRHVEERIAREFNEYADPRLEKARNKLLANVAPLPAGSDGNRTQLSFSSTPTHIHIVARRASASPAVAKVQPPTVEGNPKIVVQVHRAIVRRVINDPAVRESITMLIGQVMAGPVEPSGGKVKHEALPKYQVRWTPDRKWMVLEYNPPSPAVKPVATEAAAIESTTQPVGK